MDDIILAQENEVSGSWKMAMADCLYVTIAMYRKNASYQYYATSQDTTGHILS